jgi:hypothetical protein
VLEKVLGAVRQSGFQEAAKSCSPFSSVLISAGCSLVCQLLPREKKQKRAPKTNKQKHSWRFHFRLSFCRTTLTEAGRAKICASGDFCKMKADGRRRGMCKVARPACEQPPLFRLQNAHNPAETRTHIWPQSGAVLHLLGCRAHLFIQNKRRNKGSQYKTSMGRAACVECGGYWRRASTRTLS